MVFSVQFLILHGTFIKISISVHSGIFRCNFAFGAGHPARTLTILCSNAIRGPLLLKSKPGCFFSKEKLVGNAVYTQWLCASDSQFECIELVVVNPYRRSESLAYAGWLCFISSHYVVIYQRRFDNIELFGTALKYCRGCLFRVQAASKINLISSIKTKLSEYAQTTNDLHTLGDCVSFHTLSLFIKDVLTTLRCSEQRKSIAGVVYFVFKLLQK